MTPEEVGAWDTITGLPDDIDAWIANAHFGLKEEYKAVSKTESPMFLIDLVDETGEVIGTQGYSTGTGWEVKDGGKEIVHTTRKNIVKTSIYGMLIDRVIKDLKVVMPAGSSALIAASWNGLGFHWNQEKHKTVGGEEKSAPMPTAVLGAKKETITKAVEIKIDPDLEVKLNKLVANLDKLSFQKAAMKIGEVVKNDTLMTLVLEDGPSGYYDTHKSKS